MQLTTRRPGPTCPTRRSPAFVNATTDGVVRAPSLFVMMVGLPPSIAATAEFVVPRSIPTTCKREVGRTDKVRLQMPRRSGAVAALSDGWQRQQLCLQEPCYTEQDPWNRALVGVDSAHAVPRQHRVHAAIKATHLFATDDLPAGPPSPDTYPVHRPGGVQALACQELWPREHNSAESRSIGRAAVLVGALLQALPHSLLHPCCC